MPGKPYMPWYVGDWRKDPNVKQCSPETRGVWFDFLCEMHELKSGGVLTGDKDYLCRVGVCNLAQLDRSLAELARTRTADISSRGDTFTIINRRMKKEADTSKVRQVSGSKSISKRLANAESDLEAELKTEEWLKSEEFRALWLDWESHRINLKRPMTAIAKLMQIRELKRWGKERALVAIEHSISKGWQGIYEPKSNGFQQRPSAADEPHEDDPCTAERYGGNR
jgi:hypothetical protein